MKFVRNSGCVLIASLEKEDGGGSTSSSAEATETAHSGGKHGGTVAKMDSAVYLVWNSDATVRKASSGTGGDIHDRDR